MRSFLLAVAPLVLLTLSPLATGQQLLGNYFGLPGSNATYDYIVVGGGTAGLGVAYRLAENGTKTVAVVEAGGFYQVENGNTSSVPAYCVEYGAFDPSSVKEFPLVDWGFLTTPQAGLNNRTLHYGRGKTLGGSSAENAMIYNRGTIGSYQVWADAVDDQSWTFENLLPYFARGINLTIPDPNNTVRAANASHIPLPANPDAYNETGGPLHISYPNFALPFSSYLALAMQELGFPIQQDFISGNLLGAQYAPVTVAPDTQTRDSSQTSFLEAAIENGLTNLKVYTHTLAKQVLFDANNTATGVKVVSGISEPYVLSARSEVILSAGAFQSPQLLMVSGIGPKEELEKFNIPVLADRPGVGQNMWDHLDFGPSYYINAQGLTLSPSPENDAAVQEYIANRTGFLTSPGVDWIGWEKVPEADRANFTETTNSSLAQFPADWPEIEYEISEAPQSGSNRVTGTVIAIPVSPLSRGTVSIVSNDTSDLPVINPNWLTNEADKQVAVQAFKRARAMTQTSAIQPILIGEEVSPGLNVTSDGDIFEWIKNNAYMNWHASCTCKSSITYRET